MDACVFVQSLTSVNLSYSTVLPCLVLSMEKMTSVTLKLFLKEDTSTGRRMPYKKKIIAIELKHV